MKKLISTLLATALILSTLTVPAFAATTCTLTDEDYLKEGFNFQDYKEYNVKSDNNKGVSWPEGSISVNGGSVNDPYAQKYIDRTATSVTFPDSTVIIGVSCLSDRQSVTSTNLSELTNLKYIDYHAFKGTKIKSIDLRNTQVVKIERNAFETANNITEFYASPTLKVIGAYAIQSYSLNKVELNEGLERLESQALPGRGTYSNVILPKSLTYIASDALRMEATYKVYQGSYAEQWCKDNNVKFTYVDGSTTPTDPTTPPTTNPTTPPKMENTQVIGGVTFSNVVSVDTKTNSVGRTVHFVNITQNGCMRSDSDNTQFYYIHYGDWSDYKKINDLSVTSDGVIPEMHPITVRTYGIIPYMTTKNANGTWSKGLTWEFSRYSPTQYNSNGYVITVEINGKVQHFAVKVVGPTQKPPTETAPSTATANPTTSKVIVDGKVVAFDAYNINNNNYFKLRDIAQVIRGTEKMFEVTWNGSKNAIELISRTPYTTVGGELKAGDGKAKTATLSTSKIYKDGVEVMLTAYNINNNNYFKLRDLGQAFNFDVSWDSANNAVVINTVAHYSGE